VNSAIAFADGQEYEDTVSVQVGQTDLNRDGAYGDLASGVTVVVGPAIDLSGVTGDDAVSQIVLGNLPDGGTLTLAGVALSAGTDGKIVLTGEDLETFLADQSSLVLNLGQHTDADAALAVGVTVTDTSSGASETFDGTIDVTIDAVADQPYALHGNADMETGGGFDIPPMAHDISNIVLYLEDASGEIVKVKIDSFPGGERDPNNLDLDGFVANHHPGYELVALTVKAGNNHPAGYGPGEGELFVVKPSYSEATLPVADHADMTYQYGNVSAELTAGTWGEGGTTVAVEVTATFADYADGSETHYILVEVPDGWSVPDGTQLVDGSDLPEVTDGKTFARIPVDNADIAVGDGTVSITLELTPPSELAAGTHAFEVYAEAYETSVTDDELTLANNRAFTPGVVELVVGSEPPVTEPPTTEPPVTEPPVTEAPQDFTVYTNQYGGYVGIDDVFYNAHSGGEWTFVMPSANPGKNAYVWKANESIPDNPNTMFHTVNSYPVFEIANKGAGWHGQFDYTMQDADGNQANATVSLHELEQGTVNGYKVLDITDLAAYDASEGYNLAGCFQNDDITGGAGNDIIFTGYGTYNDIARGGAGDDIIDGGDNSRNTFWGDEGNDTIFAGGNTDTVYGGSGNDVIDAGTGNDSVWGDEGNDTILGGDGSDKLYGGDGDDYVTGDAGNDTIEGNAGNDTLLGGEGNDKIWGGDGADSLDGGAGNDTLYGGDGNDVVMGGDGNDKLYGNAGDDTLYDGAGKDTVYGGEGDDLMVGGAGNDKIYGEDGNDTYVFGEGDGKDLFNGGTDWTDTIHLDGVEGGPGAGGWTLELDGNVQFTQTDNTIEFLNDASGTIRLEDGSELTFQGIEKIEW
jgi:Ca2+-binding RTX toxin-like protein